MTGILLSLIPLFTWGIGDYVASRLSKHHPVVVNFGWSIVFLSYALVLTVLFGYELPSLNTMLAHIHRGDIYEANFCQEFYAENSTINPTEVYKHLNKIYTVNYLQELMKLNLT